MTLTDFLLARIAEDEAVAQRGRAAAEWYSNLNVDHIAWAARVHRGLAECEAKRRIVAEYLGHLRHIESRGNLPSNAVERDARVARVAVRHLAAIYADHEDYREDWS